MNYKVRGKIVSISEIKTLQNGAKELSYRIDTGEKHNNLLEFSVYKKEEYAEHIDKFIKYNKVGDKVEVEFNIRAYNWKPEAENKIFTSLSHWKINKVESRESNHEADDLPF